MSCSAHRRGVARDHSGLFILQVLLLLLSLTLAEEINNEKMTLARSMKDLEKSMCLRQLESSTSLKMLLRMYVRPIGPGSNRIHIAGTVNIPSEELQAGADWAPLRYEYTSLNKELYLNVTLNGEPLTYIPSRSMYNLRYELDAVKMYVMGRVEIFDGEECPQPETTTTTAITTTTVITTTIATNTTTATSSSITSAGTGIWVMGAAGSVPILVILVILLVLLVVVVVSVSVILWRRRKAADNASKNKDPFAAQRQPLMTQPQTARIAPPATSQLNTGVNPLYKSPLPPPPPPSYYSE